MEGKLQISLVTKQIVTFPHILVNIELQCSNNRDQDYFSMHKRFLLEMLKILVL